MREKTTSLDKIVGYLQGARKSLSPTLKARLERIDVADVLIRNSNPPKKVAAMLMKRFPDVSRATAFRYIADAKYIYGSISKTDRQYWKEIVIDNILETRRETLQAAKRLIKAGQFKEAAALFKVVAQSDANLGKYTGADRDDTDIPDFSRLQPPTQIISLHPEFLERYGNLIDPHLVAPLEKMLKETKIPRFQQITRDLPTKDIDFEDLDHSSS